MSTYPRLTITDAIVVLLLAMFVGGTAGLLGLSNRDLLLIAALCALLHFAFLARREIGRLLWRAIDGVRGWRSVE